MSTPLTAVNAPALGVTVYWQQSGVIFHGIIGGTDAALIMQYPTDKVLLSVPLSALTLDNS